MTKRGILFVLLFALSIYAFLYMDIWRVPIQTDHRFKVYRDEVGVLRIVAKDKISMFYAMGHAQATDRLWTLSFKKRLVAGRLSELFGEAVLEMDLETRNFDFYNVGMMNAKLLDSESRAYLQAYADGINDYAKSLKLLPFQFYLTWAPWEDWIVEDSIAQIGFMSFGLEFDWMYELARQRLLETVGFHLAWKMIPFGEQNHFREVTIINNKELKQQNRYK
jgi:penicillin amidase